MNLTWNLPWIDRYVDYKQLKQLINILGKEGVFTEKTLEEINSAIPSEVEESDLEEEEGNLRTSADDKPAIERRVSLCIHQSEESSFESRAFLALFRREVSKVENFCHQQFKILRKKRKAIRALVQDPPEPEIDSPSEYVPSTEEKSRSGIRKKLLGMSRASGRLEDYFSVNFAAFEKILKKFDKKVSIPKKLPPLSPSISPSLAELNEAYSKWFQAYHSKMDEMFSTFGRPSKHEVDEEAAEFEEFIITDEYPLVTRIELNSIPPRSITRFNLFLVHDGLSGAISVPCIVAKGKYEGPVLGITSAIHGNELNGIPLIQRLMREMDLDSLRGTVMAFPVMNPPGFVRLQREYLDGQDLNRVFPGKANGDCAQIYCHKIMNKIVNKFDYHIDLHTASFGRINSYYVRADMNNKNTYQMAFLQDPQIIVHNTAPDGSLRDAAMKLGIPSITVEIGDPSRIHRRFVKSAFLGVENILNWLDMLDFDEETSEKPPTVCSRSFWLYAQHGGLLTVLPEINTWVSEGDVIARVRNMFGDIIGTYVSPDDGIIVGKSVNPVCASGDRILHLGVVGVKFPKHSNDGHT